MAHRFPLLRIQVGKQFFEVGIHGEVYGRSVHHERRSENARTSSDRVSVDPRQTDAVLAD
ncbi:MAG: hypothetical protein KJZ87_06335 [Thermoguttaceae bacterium]|nr:hypothetical protein [Thermoguttaceae bacterium]